MRIPALLPTVFMASVTASALAAQEPRITRVGPGTIVAPRGGTFSYSSEEPRAVIGVSTTNSSSSRDTLGVLVSSVRAGSPAEKAGIEEGNRIASINGVNLKLAASDVGDDQMAGVMSRRLQRELERLRPGDEVDLHVFAGGQTKNVKIKTIAPADMYESASRRWADEHATLGLNIAVTGSSRDSIGVFVMSVDDDGPAAKAGIEEGSRIASINGVDLRGTRTDDRDSYVVRTSSVGRLEREVSRAKPGDEMDLRVYFNGQYKNVKVKAARLSDLSRRNRGLTVINGDNFAPLIDRIKIDGMGLGADISDQVRRAMDDVRLNRDFQGFSRAFGNRAGGRIDW